ncbi:hypothetical protein AV540_03275 [Brevibacillus parabrevis]|uniref:hypothetical protein n=1 Tax=Brevibacillus parabrevis TaxID=54914 RepID=UPI0007ABAEED|nr:hypothetical protein [Brevibacillus parabrevis]KZE40887.1 hypothetical protein AV540_03275 [Brevibacillus parabrevis]
MKKVSIAVKLLLSGFLLSSCANHSPTTNSANTTSAIASWPYPFLKVEDRLYVIADDENEEQWIDKEKLGEQIGSVEAKYDFEGDEQTAQAAIASNYLEKGTKLFAIKDVDRKEQIAWEKSEGVFVRATSETSGSE